MLRQCGQCGCLAFTPFQYTVTLLIFFLARALRSERLIWEEMRLINVNDIDKFKPHECWDSQKNPVFYEFSNNDPALRCSYAILSHTWTTNEEVTYQDMLAGPETATTKSGYTKIIRTCELAKKAEILYVWIDTCCIDKRDSAELSESINCMFNYYRDAQICYAYLSDVLSPDAFSRAKWFKRGWTLQELIAPEILDFYVPDPDRPTKAWSKFGSRDGMADEIAKITNVSIDVLNMARRPLHEYCVAQKMSWAAMRQTARTEDIAYCLLGLFGVNMPLIYGEGDKAFHRLQEEIVKKNNDMTILAWDSLNIRRTHHYSIFAPSPDAFARCGSYTRVHNATSHGIDITNRGLRVTGTRRLRFAQLPDSLARRLGTGLQATDQQLEFVPQSNCVPFEKGGTNRYVLFVARRDSPNSRATIGICLQKLTPRLFMRDMALPMSLLLPITPDVSVVNEEYFIASTLSDLQDGLNHESQVRIDFSGMKMTHGWPLTWWDLCNQRLLRPNYPWHIVSAAINIPVEGEEILLDVFMYPSSGYPARTIYRLMYAPHCPTVSKALQRMKVSYNQETRFWQELELDAPEAANLTNTVTIQVGQNHYRISISEQKSDYNDFFTKVDLQKIVSPPPTLSQGHPSRSSSDLTAVSRPTSQVNGGMPFQPTELIARNPNAFQSATMPPVMNSQYPAPTNTRYAGHQFQAPGQQQYMTLAAAMAARQQAAQQQAAEQYQMWIDNQQPGYQPQPGMPHTGAFPIAPTASAPFQHPVPQPGIMPPATYGGGTSYAMNNTNTAHYNPNFSSTHNNSHITNVSFTNYTTRNSSPPPMPMDRGISAKSQSGYSEGGGTR
ncbi:heterokaryon incompatibility protein-domain-containing protein [Xylariaceae sp. FL0255]|nr:heterokaryon incompatibility protein-domain-containing protein [Xylariaceae sp. FL0255]